MMECGIYSTVNHAPVCIPGLDVDFGHFCFSLFFSVWLSLFLPCPVFPFPKSFMRFLTCTPATLVERVILRCKYCKKMQKKAYDLFLPHIYPSSNHGKIRNTYIMIPARTRVPHYKSLTQFSSIVTKWNTRYLSGALNHYVSFLLALLRKNVKLEIALWK